MDRKRSYQNYSDRIGDRLRRLQNVQMDRQVSSRLVSAQETRVADLSEEDGLKEEIPKTNFRLKQGTVQQISKEEEIMKVIRQF